MRLVGAQSHKRMVQSYRESTTGSLGQNKPPDVVLLLALDALVIFAVSVAWRRTSEGPFGVRKWASDSFGLALVW